MRDKCFSFKACLSIVLFVAMSTMLLASDAVLTYKGNVKDLRTDTAPDVNKSFIIDFKLYSAETNGDFLWGRTVPVKIRKDGSFYTELGDSAGSPIQGARVNLLAEAFAQSEGFLWLALKPLDCMETPREKIAPVFHATFADKAIEFESLQGATIETGKLNVAEETIVDSASVKTLNVASNNIEINLDNSSSVPIHGKASKFVLTGSIKGIQHGQSGLPSPAPTDIFYLKKHNIPTIGESYSTLVFPKGSNTLGNGDGEIVDISSFGGF